MALPCVILLLKISQLLAGVSMAASHTPTSLNITTIAANGNKESTIQCWQLAAPLVPSSTAGTSGAVSAQLGEAGAASYLIIPAEFDGGLHTAPAVQWVAFTAGEAVVSLPNSSQTATIYGGKHGLILAADTAHVSQHGHITKYPSKRDTVALQLPIAGNNVPQHNVLHTGPCTTSEQV